MAKLLKFRKILSFFFGLVILLGGFLSPVDFLLQNEGNFLVLNIVDAVEVSSSPDDLLESAGISCGITNWSISGCAIVTISFIYEVTAYILTIFAILFDNLLAVSLNNNFLNQSFIAPAWTALRDAANMLFIFILVIISISIILDFGKFKSKELIAKVIMIAIAINFSLFASKVVIDAGNIFTVGFYNAIKTKNVSSDHIYILGIGAPKSISAGLMEMFNPTNMMSQGTFKAWLEDPTSGNKKAILFVIFLVAIAITFYMAYVFFMAGWTFVVRVVYLWILMVLSPLAFIAYTIPGMESYFSKWWQKLIDKSFCIVVFLFILWLLFLINDNGLFSDNTFTEGSGTLGAIIVVLLKAVIVFIFLKTALSELKKKCDDGGIGDKLTGLAKGAVGLAGIATGGALLGAGAKALGGNLMRGTVGRAAQRSAEFLEKKNVGTGATGKMTLQALRNVGDSKFGMAKEGFKTREISKIKDHHAYAKTLSKEKNIEINKLDNQGKPVKDVQGNIVKEKISAQDQYYRNIAKSKLSTGAQATVTAAATVATVASAGVLAPLTVPLMDYMRTRATAGSKASEQHTKTKTITEEIKNLKDRELAIARQALQTSKDDLESFKKKNADVWQLEEQRKTIAEREGKIEEIKEKIKKKEEELKNIKGDSGKK
ncbi:MAG: hypothetical protein PHX25_03115 [Candidatus Pacebacteria bacterium]|nr:hypothetical protein [Candidatus Paceibacterota bacterium]